MVISPLIGKERIQHTFYANRYNSECLRSDEMIVSLDVSSLFTNVPIDETVSVIRDKLQNDESLGRLTLGTTTTVMNK